MEAALALSGLLAALGIGAVGVGYFRTRGSSGGDSGPPLTTGQKTIIDSVATTVGGAAGDIFNPKPAAPVQITSPFPTIATGPSRIKTANPDTYHAAPAPTPPAVYNPTDYPRDVPVIVNGVLVDPLTGLPWK